jgi:hypothetical protein
LNHHIHKILLEYCPTALGGTSMVYHVGRVPPVHFMLSPRRPPVAGGALAVGVDPRFVHRPSIARAAGRSGQSRAPGTLNQDITVMTV